MSTNRVVYKFISLLGTVGHHVKINKITREIGNERGDKVFSYDGLHSSWSLHSDFHPTVSLSSYSPHSPLLTPSRVQFLFPQNSVDQSVWVGVDVFPVSILKVLKLVLHFIVWAWHFLPLTFPANKIRRGWWCHAFFRPNLFLKNKTGDDFRLVMMPNKKKTRVRGKSVTLELWCTGKPIKLQNWAHIMCPSKSHKEKMVCGSPAFFSSFFSFLHHETTSTSCLGFDWTRGGFLSKRTCSY